MSIMARPRLIRTRCNPDAFTTTIEIGEWLVAHQLKRPVTDEPFLLVVRQLKNPYESLHHLPLVSGPHLETHAYLSISEASAPVFASLAGEHNSIDVSASRYSTCSPSIAIQEGPIRLSVIDFLHTPLKEPFMPPFVSGFPPGEKTEAVMLAVGLEQIEERICIERDRVRDIEAWYVRAAYALSFPIVTDAMKQLSAGVKQLALGQLLAARSGGLDPRRYIAFAHELGLHEQEEAVEFKGWRYCPRMLLEDFARNYPAS